MARPLSETKSLSLVSLERFFVRTSFERFFMFFEKFSNALSNFWQKLIFSPLLTDKPKAKKIAYLGLATAFSVVANTFFEVKLGVVQFSFTIAVCALLGILMGAGYGFVACFVGDAIGFFLHPFGAYMPWVGLSNGLIAVLAGLLLAEEKLRKTSTRYKMTAIFCLLSFVICTVGITNTAFFFLYANGASYLTQSIKDFFVNYLAYFASRFFIRGQIWSCIVNYAVIFLFPILLKKLPFLSK